MLNRLLPVLIVNLLAVSGYAAEQIGDIARNTDGTVRLMMNQADAISFCACASDHARSDLGCITAPNSNHLPSAREFAQLAHSLMGAEGISEATAERYGAEDRYSQVLAVNADGSYDFFYFSHYGSKPPAGDSWNYWFWSSSVGQMYPKSAYVLYGSGDVDIRGYQDIDYGAVRCARGQ